MVITDKHLAELCKISCPCLRLITARAEFRRYEISNGKAYELCDGLIECLYNFFKSRAYSRNPAYNMKEVYESDMYDLRQYYKHQKELINETRKRK